MQRRSTFPVPLRLLSTNHLTWSILRWTSPTPSDNHNHSLTQHTSTSHFIYRDYVFDRGGIPALRPDTLGYLHASRFPFLMQLDATLASFYYIVFLLCATTSTGPCGVGSLLTLRTWSVCWLSPPSRVLGLKGSVLRKVDIGTTKNDLSHYNMPNLGDSGASHMIRCNIDTR